MSRTFPTVDTDDLVNEFWVQEGYKYEYRGGKVWIEGRRIRKSVVFKKLLTILYRMSVRYHNCGIVNSSGNGEMLERIPRVPSCFSGLSHTPDPLNDMALVETTQNLLKKIGEQSRSDGNMPSRVLRRISGLTHAEIARQDNVSTTAVSWSMSRLTTNPKRLKAKLY